MRDALLVPVKRQRRIPVTSEMFSLFLHRPAVVIMKNLTVIVSNSSNFKFLPQSQETCSKKRFQSSYPIPISFHTTVSPYSLVTARSSAHEMRNALLLQKMPGRHMLV